MSGSDAVFVGRVVDVWPSRAVIASGYTNLPLAALRNSILQRWKGSLSREEEHDIRTNTDRTALESRYGLLQRIRVAVTETLVGPEILEVYTDATSCGCPFEQGRLYLINARRDGNRYVTGACTRTSRITSNEAVEDLKTLRTWKSGRPLPPRIYGRFRTEDMRAGIRVSVRHGQVERVLQIGSDGRFSFDDLSKEAYQLQVIDERGSSAIVLDLSHVGCFEASPWYSDGWHIGVSPVVVATPPVVPLPDPPPLRPLPK
jgi:hypothetical protein